VSVKYRKVTQIIKPQAVVEGAGVRLKRSIATKELNYIDPFLLFDHFGSDNPDDFIAGFPMHPHRGIETVTYLLAGEVHHKDSIGNTGILGAGDVQWMTSGRGIMHEEMPKPVNNTMYGFQLWVNLPAKEKMTKPLYQEIHSNKIPKLVMSNGVTIKVIAGEINGTSGAVTEIAIQPTYLDVFISKGNSFEHQIVSDHAAFVYIFEGKGLFGKSNSEQSIEVASTRLAILDEGGIIRAEAIDSDLRFLLISGRPINEPIARYGPFVMNTREEIEQTLVDLRNGTFIKD